MILNKILIWGMIKPLTATLTATFRVAVLRGSTVVILPEKFVIGVKFDNKCEKVVESHDPGKKEIIFNFSKFNFFFKQKTAYEIRLSLVGSEMCIRDRNQPFLQSSICYSAGSCVFSYEATHCSKTT